MVRFTLALVAVVLTVIGVLWMTGLLTWPGSGNTWGDNRQAAENQLGGALVQPYQSKTLGLPSIDISTHAILPDIIVIPDATIAPAEEADVPARVDGQLLEVYVRLGSHVMREELLAQLDDSLARPEMFIIEIRAKSTAEVDAARAVYDALRHEVEKILEANRVSKAGPVVAASELKIREAQRDKAYFDWLAANERRRGLQWEYEQKRRYVELHQIRSPISGEVVRLFKRPGEGVKSGETVARIANLDRLYVEGAIPLPLRHMVRPGMRVLVEPERQQGWLKELRGHTATVTGLALTPDGHFLISSGEDGRLVVWDWQYSAQRPIELRDEQFSREYGCVASSPVIERLNGAVIYQLVAGCADGRIRVWKLTVSSQGRFLQHSFQVLGENGALHRTAIRCVAVSPDAQLVASGSEDGEIVISNLASRETLMKLRDPRTPREPAHRAAVTSLTFLPQGEIISASQDRSLARWRIGQDSHGNWTSELVWRVDGRSADVTQLGVSHDGRWALFENGEELRVLDTTDGQTLAVISSRRSGHFRAVAIFSPDARQVLTTTAGGRLHLWNVPPTQEEAAWFRLAYHRGFKYHTPMVLGAYSAIWAPHNVLSLPFWFHLSQAAHEPTPRAGSPELLSQPPAATTPSFAPMLPELWPVDARELRLLNMNDPSSVTCAAFSPDGRFCFTGGSDKVIRVWPTPSADEIMRPLEGIIVYVGQQVESGGGLIRIRAEMENPRLRPARLESGVRVTLSLLPDLRH